MKKLNVVIVGCGAIHQVHIEAIKKIPYANLYGVCDINEEQVVQVAKDKHCKAYTDFDEVLEDSQVDVVHICTPHYLHFPMVCKSIQKGKQVLTEKPLGLDEEECKEMIRLAKASPSKVGICLQNRYNPTSIALKKLLEDKTYGKLLGMRASVCWHRDESYYKQSNWRGKWQYEGGGLLMNQMIHTLDLMQWLGGEIIKIKGQVSNRLLKNVIEEEDTAEATIWFEEGVVGHFYATNAYSTNSSVMLELHLEAGILRIQDQELIAIEGREKKILATDYSPVSGKDYWGSSHEYLISEFYEAIKNGNEHYTSISEGLIPVGMCKKIYMI